MSSVAKVTDSTFNLEVLNSVIPVLVNFWDPRYICCRTVASVVNEVAEQYMGQVKVVEVNTDENPSVTSRLCVRSIPTLMIFQGGEQVDTVVGAVPKIVLTNTLEEHFNLNENWQ